MGEEEEDPDWLHAFQASTTSTVMLSSGSDDSPQNSPTRTTSFGEEQKGENMASSDHAGDGNAAAPNKGKKATPTRRKTPSSQEDAFDKDEGPTMESKQDKPPKRSTPKKNLVKLPSDSNASPGNSPSEANKEDDSLNNSKTKHGQQVKGKKPKGTGPKVGPDQIDDTLEQQEEGVAEEDMQDKLPEHSVSQGLPLIILDKVQCSKALIECDCDSIDLSGDIGAVGRIVISNSPNGNQDLLLDLKGTIYKSTIVPSRTFCVVSVGQTEAKVPLMDSHLILTRRVTSFLNHMLLKMIKIMKMEINLRQKPKEKLRNRRGRDRRRQRLQERPLKRVKENPNYRENKEGEEIDLL